MRLGFAMIQAIRQEIHCKLCKRALGSHEELAAGCQPKILGAPNEREALIQAQLAELLILGTCPACHQVGLVDFQIEAVQERLLRSFKIKRIEPCPKCGRKVARQGAGFAHHYCPHGCRCEVAHIACVECRKQNGVDHVP